MVSNGEEAVRFVLNNPCDVVFMDVQMPVMDGLEATRQIHRAMDANRRPVIIAVTANAYSSDREQCLAAGMDDYLSKPVKVADLSRALAAACRMQCR